MLQRRTAGGNRASIPDPGGSPGWRRLQSEAPQWVRGEDVRGGAFPIPGLAPESNWLLAAGAGSLARRRLKRRRELRSVMSWAQSCSRR